MDKLQELEEKKRHLKELRERRRNHDGLINHLLSVEVSNNTMISASVQTDATDDVLPPDSPRLREPNREIVTYDKAIQVNLREEFEELTSFKGALKQPLLEQPPEPIEVSDIQEKSPQLPALTKLKPLVVEDQQNSTHSKSFSILEVLKKSDHTSSVRERNEGSQFEHALMWDSQLIHDDRSQLLCVSLDYYEELVVAVFRCTPLQKFNTTAASWSHVRVFKWNTDELVDSIDFRGQTLLAARFLRRLVKSDIVSILLTTYTGKTMLHELACVGSDQCKRMKRNLIIKNYHAHPIYAFDEYTNVPLGKERFLVASTNGVINELSSLDLTVYRDATASTQPITQVVVEPPRASEICDLDQSDGIDEETENIHEQCFKDHLLRVALSEEVAITSLSISPSNPELLYLGTEDGGIYTIILTELEHNKIKLSTTNHGFLPSGSPPVFHSSHVVALSSNSQELLLSASLDWTCCLWDPKNNCKLSSIDVGTPIIAIQWLQDNTSAILTCNSFLVVTWQITPYVDKYTRLQRYKCSAPPQVKCKFTIEDTQNSFFTCFKVFSTGSSSIVALGSNTPKVEFYHIPEMPGEDIPNSG